MPPSPVSTAMPNNAPWPTTTATSTFISSKEHREANWTTMPSNAPDAVVTLEPQGMVSQDIPLFLWQLHAGTGTANPQIPKVLCPRPATLSGRVAADVERAVPDSEPSFDEIHEHPDFDTRVIVLFVSLFINMPWLFFAFEIIVLEALRYYTRHVHETFATGLQGDRNG